MLGTYRLYVKEAVMKHEAHLTQGTIRYREDGNGEPLLRSSVVSTTNMRKLLWRARRKKLD